MNPLSHLTGVNVEMIRCYEKINILQVPPHTEGGRGRNFLTRR
jgi:DNA-binding transcriptional MerR regulator